MKTREQLEGFLWQVRQLDAAKEYYRGWDAGQVELLEWILDEDEEADDENV